ncbi:hypothetical protein [Wielerella bovis]|uniref:hypothetical protein n=1 Tax=Wielerella bovis TaxID=2917790 RepID=UPI0020185C9A|nr:hypothetical protein [Wielerella bovis]ULJ60455.1 hypothetical protein MIS44_00765 [Wielerella bovis]
MIKKLLLLSSVAIGLSGCVAAGALGALAGSEILTDKMQTSAANSITDGELAEAAAFALNTTAGNVKISNRQNKSGQVRFVATTRGKSHQCYVTTARTGLITGKKTISDAICSGSASAGSSSGNASCNALLKAAGRC